MSIITNDESKFKKQQKISDEDKKNLANIISENIVATFKDHKISKDYITNIITSSNIYTADFDDNKAAKYNFNNNTIHISKKAFENQKSTNNIKDVDISLIHEIIHLIQRKDINKEYTKLGLCNIHKKNTKNKSYGLGLNEAATQFLASDIYGNYYSHVKYFNLDFFTVSENYYPIETVIINQMCFFTGKYPLISSTLFSDDLFENVFTMQTSKNTYLKISKNIDKIIAIQDSLSKKYLYLAKNKIRENTKINILNEIKSKKEELKKIILNTQKIIYESSFKSLYNKIEQKKDIFDIVKLLYNFEKITIIEENNNDYNEFKNNMIDDLEKLYNKFEMYNKNYLNENIGTEISMLPDIPKTSILKIIINKVSLLFNKRLRYGKNNGLI